MPEHKQSASQSSSQNAGQVARGPSATNRAVGPSAESYFRVERGSSPLALVRRLNEGAQRRVEALLQRRGAGGTVERLLRGVLSAASQALFDPRVDVLEHEGQLVVRATLPGVDLEDVQVELRETQLIISGERRERSHGRFQRAVTLPKGASLESAEAVFRDGLLEISFDLPQERPSRKLHIRTTEPNGHGSHPLA